MCRGRQGVPEPDVHAVPPLHPPRARGAESRAKTPSSACSGEEGQERSPCCTGSSTPAGAAGQPAAGAATGAAAAAAADTAAAGTSRGRRSRRGRRFCCRPGRRRRCGAVARHQRAGARGRAVHGYRRPLRCRDGGRPVPRGSLGLRGRRRSRRGTGADGRWCGGRRGHNGHTRPRGSGGAPRGHHGRGPPRHAAACDSSCEALGRGQRGGGSLW
mmetsp:Transcript_12561/g.39328  ORF Transcript_12561/g.39328 Transcript_12561/m.39328 type:complete len:215 (+) Transcript_12561:332-976(+)